MIHITEEKESSWVLLPAVGFPTQRVRSSSRGPKQI